MQRRVDEIDDLIQRIYEDNVSHKISDERFAIFSQKYEAEQRELRERILESERYLSEETDKTDNLQKFVSKVKAITEPTELTPELLHEFIDRIVVSAPRYLDGKRYQLVDIHYKGVGIINTLSPEEMEGVFQQYRQEQKAHRIKQSQKVKTA